MWHKGSPTCCQGFIKKRKEWSIDQSLRQRPLCLVTNGGGREGVLEPPTPGEEAQKTPVRTLYLDTCPPDTMWTLRCSLPCMHGIPGYITVLFAVWILGLFSAQSWAAGKKGRPAENPCTMEIIEYILECSKHTCILYACALGLLVDECTIHMLSGRGKKLGLLRPYALWTVRRQTLRSSTRTAVSKIGFKQPTILITQICCESAISAEGRKYTVGSTLSVGWDLSLLSSTIPYPALTFNTIWHSMAIRVQFQSKSQTAVMQYTLLCSVLPCFALLCRVTL